MMLIAALFLAALLYVAPLAEVVRQIGRMRPAWVAVAIGVELASCLGYVIIFRRIFPEPSRRDGLQVAWMAMGAGAVLPGGNISSAAATSLLLRRHGIGLRELVKRCGGLLCLLTAFGFAVNGSRRDAAADRDPRRSARCRPCRCPDPRLDRLPGWCDAARSLGPSSRVARAAGAAGGGDRVRGCLVGRATTPLAVAGGCRLPAARHGCAVRRVRGDGPPTRACSRSIIGYCIGYLATTIPIPAGIGVLDTGLAAALVLYGMNPAASVSAVLVYHAISIWVPGVGGLIAWMPTRRPRTPRAAPVPMPRKRARGWPMSLRPRAERLTAENSRA